MARFSPLRYGERLSSIAEIARKSQRKASVVSRAITAAFREGLVAIERRIPAEPQRNHTLEQELTSHFPELWECRVIVTPETGLRLDQPTVGDRVHEEIGAGAAAFLSTSALFQN